MRLRHALLLFSTPLIFAACTPADDGDGLLVLAADSGIIVIGGDAAAGDEDAAPVSRPPAEPDERLGLACDEPGAFGPPCISLCARPGGGICTFGCDVDGDCPGGYECRALDRGDRFCLPVDVRCPPDGPVLGRDPDCGCLDGWSVGTGDDEICTRDCAEEPCGEGYVCDENEQICLLAAPLEGEFVDRVPADGAEVSGATHLRWAFESPGSVRTFDVYLGPAGEDPPLYSAGRPASGGVRGGMLIPAEVMDAGGTWVWKVAAHQGGRRAESALWRFVVDALPPAPGPCPDVPSVRIGQRNYATVLIGRDCWIEQGPIVGSPAGGPNGLTSYDDGTVQHVRHVGDGYFYSWWEAHNDYGVGADDVTLVGPSICPDGWRLPTQNEWRRAVSAGNQINPGAPSSALDLSLATGLYNVRDAEIDRCDVDGERRLCSSFDGHAGTGTYFFWAADEGDPAEAATVRVSRPSNGSTAYGFGTGRSAPTFGMQVRCIAE